MEAPKFLSYSGMHLKTLTVQSCERIAIKQSDWQLIESATASWKNT